MSRWQDTPFWEAVFFFVFVVGPLLASRSWLNFFCLLAVQIAFFCVIPAICITISKRKKQVSGTLL
jgi:hypothetical protein